MVAGYQAGGCGSKVLTVVRSFTASVDDGPVKDQLFKIGEALENPLRIAVAGRMCVGKSTLVNGLLGQQVAPTGALETTRVVSWYTSGDYEDVLLQFKDGTTRRASLDLAGRVPEKLGVDPELLESIKVALPTSQFLREADLIDTCGLSSANDEVSERTQRAFFATSTDAISNADALVFLLRLGGSADDRDAVTAFHDITTGAEATCSLNTIGLVSQADQLGDDVDPLGAGRRIARNAMLHSELRFALAEMVPVVGLLAETVNCSLLDATAFQALRAMAGGDIDDVVASLEDFRDAAADAGVRPELADEILNRIGLYGARVALRAIKAGVTRLAAVYDTLLAASGFREVDELVRRTFFPRGDVLKADQALGRLSRLSYQVEAKLGHEVRAQVERLRLLSGMHAVRELWALRECADIARRGLPGLPDELERELLRVTTNVSLRDRLGLPPQTPVADVQRLALEGATRAHRFAAEPATSARARHVAEVLRLSYGSLWQQADQEAKNSARYWVTQR